MDEPVRTPNGARSVGRPFRRMQELFGSARSALMKRKLAGPLALLLVVGVALLLGAELLGLKPYGRWLLCGWLAVAVLLLLPRLHAMATIESGSAKEWAEVDNAARQTLLQIGGGILIAAGVATAYLQYKDTTLLSKANLEAASATLALTREAQRSERFARTLDQLRSGEEQTRLAGVLTLERMSREFDADQWTIAEVLTAFIRTQAKRGAIAENSQVMLKYPPYQDWADAPHAGHDVQAAISVLGRNSWRPGAELLKRRHSTYYRRNLDLRNTDLRGLDLTDFQAGPMVGNVAQSLQPPQRVLLVGADLRRAILTRAWLENADLTNARLDHAYVRSANLTRATLTNASLVGADLQEADLARADLGGADLRNAYALLAAFDSAIFVKADLRGARLDEAVLRDSKFWSVRVDGASFKDALICRTALSGAIGLSTRQLAKAEVDRWSTLPEGVERPAYKAELDDVCKPPDKQTTATPSPMSAPSGAPSPGTTPAGKP
jgi:uncharacterized protein YjbI with pentapeptide repeats